MGEPVGLVSQVQATLRLAVERLRAARLAAELVGEFDRLAAEVGQPCVVAVAGRVKAGKSTFINALLGEDLAKVGTTETTATINYFRYGAASPERPVRCFWRGGQITDESRSFLDGLQGNDEETLRRAEGINHLEYRLLNPYLERVTLVDTPGTGAAIDEHQDRVAEFMGLRGQLRERHDQETRRIAGEADAVIYLVGPTARVDDQTFLEEFRQLTRGRAGSINAIGVLAKIDLQPELIEGGAARAATIAAQLKGDLNVVLPVSAGLRLALDRLLADGGTGIAELRETLRGVPAATLTKMLAIDEFYLDYRPPERPVCRFERDLFEERVPWTVFTTVVRAADGECDDTAVIGRLETIAGFAALKDVLERRFLKRGTFLRCYRIVNDARRLLDTIRFEYLPASGKQRRDEDAKRRRFSSFIQASGGDATVARELAAFVDEHLAPAADLGPILEELDRAFSAIYHELEQHNDDYEALQFLEDHKDRFSIEELNELRALLGLYGFETEKRLPGSALSLEHVEERQQLWYRASLYDAEQDRRWVAERAVARYGLILDELLALAVADSPS